MPAAHTPSCERAPRAKRAAPVPTRYRDADDDKKGVEAAVTVQDAKDDSTSRTSALSPNRTVVSPAPAAGDQRVNSPMDRNGRTRVRKKMSDDDSVGGIESLIPKSRSSRGAGGSDSPLASPGPHHRTATSPGGRRDSPGTACVAESPTTVPPSKKTRVQESPEQTSGLVVSESVNGTSAGCAADKAHGVNGESVEQQSAAAYLGASGVECGGEQSQHHVVDSNVEGEVKEARYLGDGSAPPQDSAAHQSVVEQVMEAGRLASSSGAFLGGSATIAPAIVEATKSGMAPSIVMWTPADDALLRLCCENGVGFRVAADEMPFTSRFSARDLEGRWYQLLYDADVAGEVAMEVVAMEHNIACPRTTSHKKGHGQHRHVETSVQLASSLLSMQALPDTVRAHGMVPLVAPSNAPGQPPYAAVDGRSCHYVVYKNEFCIGRCVVGEGGSGAGAVDVDLGGEEGNVGRISRRHVVASRDGRSVWSITNIGRRPVYVNGVCVSRGGRQELASRSAIVICGICVTFVAR